MTKPDNDKRDEVLRRMLKTPPKPHKPIDKDLADLAREIGQEDPNKSTLRKKRPGE